MTAIRAQRGSALGTVTACVLTLSLSLAACLVVTGHWITGLACIFIGYLIAGLLAHRERDNPD